MAVGCYQCDRLAADMAVELKKHGVATISLWPGAVQTELVSDMILDRNVVGNGNFKVPHPLKPDLSWLFQNAQPLRLSFPQMRGVFESGETTELAGRCLVGLAKGRRALNMMAVSSDSLSGNFATFHFTDSISLPEDKSVMSLTGKILMTCDLSRRYGIKDIDGKQL